MKTVNIKANVNVTVENNDAVKMKVVPSKMIRVKLSEIKGSNHNRNICDKHVGILMGKITQTQFVMPILVQELSNSKHKYIVVEGHHRLEACFELGIDEIDVIINHRTNGTDNRELIRDTNNTQKKWTGDDYLREDNQTEILEFKKENGFNDSFLMKVFGYNKQDVEGYTIGDIKKHKNYEAFKAFADTLHPAVKTVVKDVHKRKLNRHFPSVLWNLHTNVSHLDGNRIVKNVKSLPITVIGNDNEAILTAEIVKKYNRAKAVKPIELDIYGNLIFNQ